MIKPPQATRWLLFQDVTPVPGRTRIIRILSRTKGDCLGHIRWFGRWHQYAFHPAPDTWFNAQCLEDIQTQVRWLMSVWRDDVKQRRLAAKAAS